MIHPSEHLRNFIARHTADELRVWADRRLRSQDTFPMLYAGKEVEKPHEAIAAALTLVEGELTPEKRAALIQVLRDVRRELEDAFLNGNFGPRENDLCKSWAEVIDLALPPELQKEARLLLHAALESPPAERGFFAPLAAAATAYPGQQNSDPILWTKLLVHPETAALAFQRLLSIHSFDEMAKVWADLFERKLTRDWPTNMRVLTASLLRKAPAVELAARALGRLLRDRDHANAAIQELAISQNPALQSVVSEFEPPSPFPFWISVIGHEAKPKIRISNWYLGDSLLNPQDFYPSKIPAIPKGTYSRRKYRKFRESNPLSRIHHNSLSPKSEASDPDWSRNLSFALGEGYNDVSELMPDFLDDSPSKAANVRRNYSFAEV
jgi:hypothetical protein